MLDRLTAIISGTEDVGSAFKKMAQSIIADLVRIGIQKAIIGAIGGGTGFFGFADGGSLSSIPGRADGGSLGGLISGPGDGRSDSILALLSGPGGGAVRLSNREFIMNERAVQFYGADTMAAINGRRLPRFATGGSLSGSTPSSILPTRAPSLSSLGSQASSGSSGNVTVSIALSEDLDARIDNRAAGVAVEVVSLNGPVHRFPIVAIESARQTGAANPTVRSGAGGGNSCPLQGLPASQRVLVTGDLMTVFLPSGHRRLVCLTQDLVSDSQGQATAVFGPELGEAPAVGAVVEIQRPYAMVALTSEPPGWDVEPGQMYQFAVTAEERK